MDHITNVLASQKAEEGGSVDFSAWSQPEQHGQSQPKEKKVHIY